MTGAGPRHEQQKRRIEQAYRKKQRREALKIALRLSPLIILFVLLFWLKQWYLYEPEGPARTMVVEVTGVLYQPIVRAKPDPPRYITFKLEGVTTTYRTHLPVAVGDRLRLIYSRKSSGNFHIIQVEPEKK